MAENKGTKVIAPIVTPNSNDTYPTHISNMGKGGYHTVQTLADRDNISLDRREEGMLCGVVQDGVIYQLKGGTDNAFWEIFTVGAGGATSASGLSYSPTGTLTDTDVQSAIDTLESKKVSIGDIYTKAEVDNILTNISFDYNKLTNLPNLDLLHEHKNILTLEKFSETQGDLVWNGRTLGNMIADMYDSDGDGLVDKAKTLEGLTVSSNVLNYTAGLTGNIQQQINAISSGTIFKGEYDTFADMSIALPNPNKGYWIFIKADENYSDAQTQYYHDGTDWIYGGGSSQTPSATDTTKGSIMLSGALGNLNGTAENPLLNETGVVAGLYKNANIVIDTDGRISHAEEGSSAYINDNVASENETWSSSKINDLFTTKSNTNHTHTQLHNANVLGNVELDTTTLSDKRVISYNAVTGKAEWVESKGGKVYVGSKVINGDYRLVAGSFISLFIDETAKTITINSTATGNGGGGVPTLTEITETVFVKAGESIDISLDSAFTKYDLRTLEASNLESSIISVEVFDQAKDGRRVYYSNKEKYIYDIVNVPIHDKDESNKIHLKISNHSAVDSNVSLNINITNLI